MITSKLAMSNVVIAGHGQHNRRPIEAYERDVTHIIREDAAWWLSLLERHFANVSWQHHIDGLKDNWHRVDPKGNAVFIARSSLDGSAT